MTVIAGFRAALDADLSRLVAHDLLYGDSSDTLPSGLLDQCSAVRDQTEGVTAQLLASKLVGSGNARLKLLRPGGHQAKPASAAVAKRSRAQKQRRLARRASR